MQVLNAVKVNVVHQTAIKVKSSLGNHVGYPLYVTGITELKVSVLSLVRFLELSGGQTVVIGTDTIDKVMFMQSPGVESYRPQQERKENISSFSHTA